ncbi:MAG: FAD binding domain-containing protein [Boseongicola sp.]
MYDFDFIRPTTLDEAIAALADEDAQPLAGGQTLIPTMKVRLAAPATLVSLAGIPELNGVRREDDAIVIGATTTHATVARDASAVYPGLAALAGQIGDPAVRNRGTIGGSLANNDPSACYPAAALGSDAIIITNTREVPAGDFFDGLFGTVLEEDEIIVAVRFPIPDAAAYAKMPQPASRFAMAGAFVARFGTNVRVAITGAGDDGVFRWSEAEKVLESGFSPTALESLTIEADEMIGDIHAAPDYRSHLVGVMTRRAVAAIS